MRIYFSLIMLGVSLLLISGCTTTPNKEKPKIHCPACGTELDAIFQTNF